MARADAFTCPALTALSAFEKSCLPSAVAKRKVFVTGTSPEPREQVTDSAGPPSVKACTAVFSFTGSEEFRASTNRPRSVRPYSMRSQKRRRRRLSQRARPTEARSCLEAEWGFFSTSATARGALAWEEGSSFIKGLWGRAIA